MIRFPSQHVPSYESALKVDESNEDNFMITVRFHLHLNLCFPHERFAICTFLVNVQIPSQADPEFLSGVKEYRVINL